MSKEDLNRFCLLVLRDPALQSELKEINDRDEFIEKVRELSAVSRLDVTREDIELRMRENRRLWHERWI